MRKTMYILLGLLLVGGAIGLFVYRQSVLQEAMTIEQTAETEAAEPAPAPSTDRRAEQKERRQMRKAERISSRRDAGNLRWFEMVLNVANIAVGLVGIWLAVAGTRMRREAMAARSAVEK